MCVSKLLLYGRIKKLNFKRDAFVCWVRVCKVFYLCCVNELTFHCSHSTLSYVASQQLGIYTIFFFSLFPGILHLLFRPLLPHFFLSFFLMYVIITKRIFYARLTIAWTLFNIFFFEGLFFLERKIAREKKIRNE